MGNELMAEIKSRWPRKFREQERYIFQNIRPGNRIFVGTGCGEPQYLVSSLLNFAHGNPQWRERAIQELITLLRDDYPTLMSVLGALAYIS